MLYTLKSFDLKSVNIEEKNYTQNLTALQIVEINVTDNAEWLERFRALV